MSPQILRGACERLDAIATESSQWHQEFPFGGFLLGESDEVPAHRCLSAPEAHSKLGVIEQRTGQPLDLLLSNWDQLPVATLQTIQNVVLLLDEHERRQGAAGQVEDWVRLDELLFRLSFQAWLHGTNFAPAPRPAAVEEQIDIPTKAYTGCLQRLRDELAEPTWEDCQPRVDLWLGDPPRNEAGAQSPRLWVSSRCHHRSAKEAAGLGLLPANTSTQVQSARAAIYRRWLDRDDDELDALSSRKIHRQNSFCRRCGKMLFIHAPLGVRGDV